MESKKLLDDVGWQILIALQSDGRISVAELGRAIGMSPPAVAERIRRLEEAGLITGYRATVSAAAVGLPVAAFIRLQTPSQQYPVLTARLRQMPEVLECHHLAGPDSFIIKVAATSPGHLERVIGQLSQFGPTNTSIVLSSPFETRPISRPAVEVD